MAKSAVIGALRVNLGIDTAQFSDGLGVSQKKLDAFAKKAAVGAAVVGAAATAAATAIAVGVRRTIDSFGDLANMADVANASVSEFGRLSYAVKSVGMESEKLADIYKDVNDRIGDFWATGGGPMLDFFEQIAPKVGITAEAFRNLSGPQALQLYYDTLVKAGASQQDLTSYLEAMASDATKLIPLLADGGKRFAELGDQAERLGIIIDRQTAEAAKQFSINLGQLSQVTDGFYTQVAAQLLPVMELATERFIDLANNSDLVKEAAGGLVGGLEWVSNEVGQLTILTARLNVELAATMEAASKFNNYDFSGAWKAFQKGQNASAEMAANLRKEIEFIFSGNAVSQGAIQRRIDGAFGEAGTKAGKTFIAKFQESAAGSPNAFQQLVTRMQESIAEMQVDADALTMTTGAAAQYTATMDLLRAATEAGIPITDAVIQQINTLAAAYGNTSLAMEGVRLGMELMNDPFSILQQELAELEAMLAAGAISWTEWSDAAVRAKMVTATEVLGLAGQLTGALGQMFGDSKGWAIAEAVINTAQAITKTIAQYGATPWGLAAAGVAAATGAAQIATIARTNKGSKSAPSVRGAAGRGGAANNNTPGESSQSVVIQLQGDVYNRQSVEDLIKQLQDAQRDGHQLLIKTV